MLQPFKFLTTPSWIFLKWEEGDRSDWLLIAGDVIIDCAMNSKAAVVLRFLFMYDGSICLTLFAFILQEVSELG